VRVVNADISLWKTDRLREVAGSTVRREMNLLAAIFEVARKEWVWIKVNPCADVKRPPDSPHRKRVISPTEEAALLDALGWTGDIPQTSAQWTALAFKLCCVNGFRDSEVLSIDSTRYDWARPVVELGVTKNGEMRSVPLLPEAIELLKLLPQSGFPISSAVRDVKFRVARDSLGLSDLTFHDSRHTAATRISRFVKSGQLTVFEFCRVFGWKNINQALVYVNDTADEIATRLAAFPTPSPK
jgi:integrase